MHDQPGIKYIRKRDGRVLVFEATRIESAILKAMAAVGHKDGPTAKGLTAQVVAVLEQRFRGAVPTVEDVQDAVEEVLMRSDLDVVARAYILYRKRRTEIRDAKTFFGVRDDLKLSLNAISVLQRRYLLKDDGGRVAETPREMFARVASVVASADKLYGDVDLKRTEQEFYEAMVNLEFLPNSPTLMNAGLSLGQLSGCFVLPVDDSLLSIFDAVKYGAIVHQSGGGTGFSFSKLRPKGDVVRSTKGIASGPVSFMRVFDVATDVIKQGGKRRGANMGVLRCDHPDVMEFVASKSKQGFLSNFNISVALTDEFMRKVETGEEYDLVNPRTGEAVRRVKARDVFDLMAMMAWSTGDPGVIFLDEVNRHNPTPALGAIESTNPCVTGDTRISTEHGLMTMKQLVDDYGNGEIAIAIDTRVPVGATNGTGSVSLLSSEKGVKFMEISRAFRVGEKETYRVLTESGYELVCTSDHKMLTNDGWVSATALNTRHRVLIQSGEGKFRKSRSLQFSVRNRFCTKNGREICLNLPRRWSKELGQVVGWLIGDGWLRSGDENCRVGFTFANDDREVMKHIERITNRWYGRKIKKVKRQPGIYHLSYHSKYFGEFFVKLGVLPVDGQDKRVPDSIFMATRPAVIGFLQGLFTADGTVGLNSNGTTYVRLTSKSLGLIKDTQLLLLNLGIRSKVYNRSRRPRRIFPYVSKDGKVTDYRSDGVCFELQISRDSMSLFLKRIGFLGGKNRKKLEKLSARSYYRSVFEDGVVSVTPAGIRPVYDLTEPVTFSFIANGIVSLDCGEQPLLPYESCNLGSINLAGMVKNGNIDWERLRKTVRVAVHFLDNVIDVNRYPLQEIEKVTKSNRKIGLGVMGFADMLIALGIPYDSQKALEVAQETMKFISEAAVEESVEIAGNRGSFPNFRGSTWEKRGFERIRNATLTTIAPTGTVSIIAGCSSGIEPLFAISYVRNVLEGSRLLEVNPLFEQVARERNFYTEKLMIEIAKTGSLRDIKEVPEEVKRLFVTALDISPEWHVRIQSAFQRYVDNAVSKTINLPQDAAVEDVREAFMLAYKLHCKGITVYRYGSKPEQVLYLGSLLGKERGETLSYVSAQQEYAGGCPDGRCDTTF